MIYIHQITHIGTFHGNHCEDYALTAQIGEHRYLLAVMDGCTMGDESHFAATLVGRLLRKIAKEEYYKEYREGKSPSTVEQIERVFARLFSELTASKDRLQLERNELLTTVLVGIFDTMSRQGEILCLGDGVVSLDGRLIEWDQHNQPDYLAYHLEEQFAEWYAGLAQRIALTEFKDVALCTDGIFTFTDKTTNARDPQRARRALENLLFDQSDLSNERMLHKKLYRIEHLWNMVHTDDLGIVRLVIR